MIYFCSWLFPTTKTANGTNHNRFSEFLVSITITSMQSIILFTSKRNQLAGKYLATIHAIVFKIQDIPKCRQTQQLGPLGMKLWREKTLVGLTL